MSDHDLHVTVLADEPAQDPLCTWLTDRFTGASPLSARSAVRVFDISRAAEDLPLCPLEGDALSEQRLAREAHAELVAALPRCNTLITYGGPVPTCMAVSSAFLESLAEGALWLQLGPMPLHIAAHLAQRARDAGVAFVHAPYLRPPRERDERPMCVAFADQDTDEGDVGLRRARALLEALSSQVNWMGWLRSTEAARWVSELSRFSRAAARGRAVVDER